MPIEPEGGDEAGPSATIEGATSRENPMYSAYMHMTPDEKKVTWLASE